MTVDAKKAREPCEKGAAVAELTKEVLADARSIIAKPSTMELALAAFDLVAASHEALRKRAEDAEAARDGAFQRITIFNEFRTKAEAEHTAALASLARVRGVLLGLCDAVEEETQSLDAHDADNFSWVQSSVRTFHTVVAEARAEAEEAAKEGT
jgi:hypothetical protein